jgi:HK97 family phage portal protein
MLLKAGRFGIRANLNPFEIEFRSNLSEPDRWLVEYAGGHPTASGQTMTERTAMQLLPVYCAVGLISDTIAGSALKLWKKLQPNGREEADDHPLYPILASQPNEEMTAVTFWETLVGHLLLWGNMYGEIERNGAGQVVAIWPLRPDRTFPRRRQDASGKELGPLYYVARSSAGPEVELKAENVFHVLGYSYDGLRGLSPVALARESLGLSMATQDYGARFFGNDARPGGVLETPQKMKNEAAKRLKQSWEEAHRGGAQAHRTALLESGVTWKAMGMPNEDAQFLETRQFQIQEVARMFHVPPHMLMEMSSSTFSNIEHQAIEFVKHACVPWACRIEQEIARKLLTPAEALVYYAHHDFKKQMRGDLKSRYEAHQISWTNGWRSADDIGEEENWNPQPDSQGATYFVPVTQQPVDRAINPPDPPAPIHILPGGAPPPAKGGKAKGKVPPKQRAEVLRQVALAYAPAIQHVLDRLERKEKAVAERMANLSTSLKRADAWSEFSVEHAIYVRDAFQPVTQRLAESVRTFSDDTMTRGAEDAMVEAYRTGYVHRHMESLKLASVDRPIAHDEAMRMVNAFTIGFYKAAGIESVIWIPPESPQYCCTRCLEIQRQPVPIDQAHPPLHAGCECVIVPAD